MLLFPPSMSSPEKMGQLINLPSTARPKELKGQASAAEVWADRQREALKKAYAQLSLEMEKLEQEYSLIKDALESMGTERLEEKPEELSGAFSKQAETAQKSWLVRLLKPLAGKTDLEKEVERQRAKTEKMVAENKDLYSKKGHELIQAMQEIEAQVFDLYQAKRRLLAALPKADQEEVTKQADEIRAARIKIGLRGKPSALEDVLFSLMAEHGPLERTTPVTIERAVEILGRENVHGPEDVELALGIKLKPEDIPPIPFTSEDLESRIRDVHHMLVLCVADEDGQPFTMEKLEAKLKERFASYGNLEIASHQNWHQQEPFFTEERLAFSWKLLSKEGVDWAVPLVPLKGDDPIGTWTEDFGGFKRGNPDRVHLLSPITFIYTAALHYLATERLKQGSGEIFCQRALLMSTVRYEDDPRRTNICEALDGNRYQLSFEKQVERGAERSTYKFWLMPFHDYRGSYVTLHYELEPENRG
jgi:hypothetical protein